MPTKKALSENKPDFVINCAAYNKVDEAEKNKDIAFKVNAIAPKNLAILSNELNFKLIHFSTDFVFDGYKSTKYIETDNPNPLSYYGYSKLWGEKFIQSHSINYIILRTSWLYGKGKQNIIYKLLQKAKLFKELSLPDNIFGLPTSCKDIVNQTYSMMEQGNVGLYHCAAEGNKISIYEYGKLILKLYKRDNNVLPINSIDKIRPTNAVLENYMLNMEDINAMRFWKNSLQQFVLENNV